MRIALITAGAGKMYCGSCLRDNTLAAGLMDAGHEVALIPTYTPTRTDERNVSLHRVFLGGINVYLQQNFSLFRKSPLILDRLLDSVPLLRLVTRWGIRVDASHLGRLTVSMLRGTEGFQRKEILSLARFVAREISPDVVNLPNTLLLSLAAALKAEMKAPVCCTLQGEDLFIEGLGEPYRSEAIRLIRGHACHVDRFVAVSDFGARTMAEYLGIDRSRIHVVPLGVNFDGYTRRTGPEPEAFTVGYLARVAPEKGLHVLCDGYRRLRTLAGASSSRLWAAGYLAPEHHSYLDGIRRSMEACGLSGQFHYHGELDRKGKLAFLSGLSVFSVPGPYADPKGLFLLEAMAGGIPVVQPRTGAFPEIIETTGGGILVEPNDPDSLAHGLLELWRDPEKRRELGWRGYEGVRRHYSSKMMADRILSVYQSVTSSAVGVG